MRFLADEGCDGTLVRLLRERGHNVVHIAETNIGATDDAVLNQATNERQILITEDKDFGELIYRQQLAHAGIILLRVDATLRKNKANRIFNIIDLYGDCLHDCFVVIQNSRTRVRQQNDTV